MIKLHGPGILLGSSKLLGCVSVASSLSVTTRYVGVGMRLTFLSVVVAKVCGIIMNDPKKRGEGHRLLRWSKDSREIEGWASSGSASVTLLMGRCRSLLFSGTVRKETVFSVTARWSGRITIHGHEVGTMEIGMEMGNYRVSTFADQYV